MIDLQGRRRNDSDTAIQMPSSLKPASPGRDALAGNWAKDSKNIERQPAHRRGPTLKDSGDGHGADFLSNSSTSLGQSVSEQVGRSAFLLEGRIRLSHNIHALLRFNTSDKRKRLMAKSGPRADRQHRWPGACGLSADVVVPPGSNRPQFPDQPAPALRANSRASTARVRAFHLILDNRPYACG